MNNLRSSGFHHINFKVIQSGERSPDFLVLTKKSTLYPENPHFSQFHENPSIHLEGIDLHFKAVFSASNILFPSLCD